MFVFQSQSMAMATEKTSMYEDAVTLLERINSELKDSEWLGTINTKMVGVVKDLNDVRIKQITGSKSSEEENKRPDGPK